MLKKKLETFFRKRHIAGKGENAGHQHFSFPQNVFKMFFTGVLKSSDRFLNSERFSTENFCIRSTEQNRTILLLQLGTNNVQQGVITYIMFKVPIAAN